MASGQGVLVVPELGRVYATATDANQLVAIDTRTLQIVARPAGGTPTAMTQATGSCSSPTNWAAR